MEPEGKRKQMVCEFKEAYEKEFKEPISEGEAENKLEWLANLLHTIIYGASDSGPEDLDSPYPKKYGIIDK